MKESLRGLLMKSKRYWVFILALLTVAIVFSGALCKKKEEIKVRESLSPSSKILKDAGEECWNLAVEENPVIRMRRGLRIVELPDISSTYAKYQAAFAESILKKLQEVKLEELSHQEKISLEILKWGAENSIEGLRFYWLYIPVTPYSSPLRAVHQIYTGFQFKKKDDLTYYLDLLTQYPSFIESIQAKLEEQYTKSIVLPEEEISFVISFLGSLIKEGDRSLFYVSEERLGKIKKSLRKRFEKEVLQRIKNEINPSLEKLVNFISGEYKAKAPLSVGLWQYPEGREYYKYLVRVNTTMGLAPEEIQRIGLEQVEKDRQKVDELRKSIGFKGTMEEFCQFLKADSKFFPKTAEEIGERLLSYVNAVNSRLDQVFLRKPRAPYGVRRLAPELEASMTFGYYQPPTPSQPEGIYYYNGSRLEERSLVWAEGLIYHELVPGHHFHFAFQSENAELPDFRKENVQTAFSEGWAEYASWLGLDMGLYQDPYSLCGKYMMDMFLSSRLVVDTGMNYLEWPRSRAAKFMKDHLLESETQINSETLRYSTDMPAQALAYKLGSMKFFELREKARRALGDKFDIRKFHDAILGSGSMPLPVLEQHIDWFIGQELAASRK